MDKDRIMALFNANCLDEAEALLDDKKQEDQAWVFYMRGRIEWKKGNKTEAISFYEKAAADPESEAATALEQAREIMDFYNKDLYNP